MSILKCYVNGINLSLEQPSFEMQNKTQRRGSVNAVTCNFCGVDLIVALALGYECSAADCASGIQGALPKGPTRPLPVPTFAEYQSVPRSLASSQTMKAMPSAFGRTCPI